MGARNYLQQPRPIFCSLLKLKRTLFGYPSGTVVNSINLPHELGSIFSIFPINKIDSFEIMLLQFTEDLIYSLKNHANDVNTTEYILEKGVAPFVFYTKKEYVDEHIQKFQKYFDFPIRESVLKYLDILNRDREKKQIKSYIENKPNKEFGSDSEITISDVLSYYDIEHTQRMASCPFHRDRHPSFSFNNVVWKCWSCGRKGNVFSLIKMLESGLSE